MARPILPDEASAYYPPRARWYAGVFNLGHTFRRRLGLERLAMPRAMSVGELIAGFFIPGLAVWLRGPALWGRAALFVCAELLFVFILWLGYPFANFAFGLLLSAHCTGFVYYCSPLLASESFRGRLAFTALVLLVLGLLIYLPALHFLQEHWLTPLRRGEHVYVVQHVSRPGQIQRGDWVAYSLDESAVGENYHGGTVVLHSGVTLGQVLAVPGDVITFTNDVFFVNGLLHTNLPHIPTSGGFTVAEKHWFIWPNLGVSGHGDVGEARLRTAMLGLADVPETNFIGAVSPLVLAQTSFTMSRFVNLEFSDNADNQLEPEQKACVKDEAYYLAEARTAFETGNFEQGLRFYSKVLEYNPKNAGAWTGQVRMLIELGEYREAKLWADKALERFPNEPELLAAKGVALGRSGDLQGALAFSDASIEERGDTPYVWLARGDVLLARAETRADYCFEKAMLLAPRDWFIAWLASRIRLFYGQFVLALKLLQQAVEWNPGNFLLWLAQGHCQQALGMVGPAQMAFTQARQLNPRCDEADSKLLEIAQTGVLARLCGKLRGLFRR